MTIFKRQQAPQTSVFIHPFLRRRITFLPCLLLLSTYVVLVHRFFENYHNYLHSTHTTLLPDTPGIIILGMHRSSTSMLSGLLVKGFGYELGGPALPAADDNPKGFFERNDVVDMNNAFLNMQEMTWDNHELVVRYNASLTEAHLRTGFVPNSTLDDLLQFYNGKHDIPYLHKDPRMCLTLPVWLEHLSHRPAILFTYRHPLAVVMSLQKRDNFPLIKGLTLWIIYNVLAIQYSKGYCRVVTSSDAIVYDTLHEMIRISQELTDRCHVITAPNITFSSSVVNEFVDHSLQHNTNRSYVAVEHSNTTILQDFGNGCVAHLFTSDHIEESVAHMKERQLYLMAMKLFCDFESGTAFRTNYKLPDLTAIDVFPPSAAETH